ncbi:MAG: beta-ketoacyl synthase chain length factor [Hylemonella sp.]|uniref:beta-ketoacyl synthase chain length factor n=1 Tax=Hylemonella sp. TaxID=2066020 RepID=UPI003918EFAD
MTLTVHLQGIGVYGPGLTGWTQTADVLAGRQAYEPAPLQLPAPDALPAAERRRAGTTIKLAFAVGFEAIRQAGADASTLRSVFSSSGGDCDNCHAILETLASADRAVSPTRFHNSVHNAPSGYWSIATACRAATTSLCAYDGSFAAGLLEAATQVHSAQEPCLLLTYDTPYPGPLGAPRRISQPFGLALLLAPAAGAGTLARLDLALARQAPQRLDDAALDALRLGAPAARGLPLLQAIARGVPGQVVLEYLEGMSLDVSLRPAA